MADTSELSLSLGIGGEEMKYNDYHTLDSYPGQLEREDVYDEGKSLNMQLSLVDVIHGTLNALNDSSPATLIIADFRFISRDPSRRFKHADIELRFRSTNDPADLTPPEVFKIAPMGSWGLQKSEKQEERERGAKLDGGVSSVGSLNLGVDYRMTTTQTQYDEATIEGISTKRKRKIQPKNAAVWSMSENDDIGKGIPSLLRTAILLKRTNYEDFYGYISVKTDVNRSLRSGPSVESRESGGDTNHVRFSPMKKRTTESFAGIKPSELGAVLLTDLMAVTTRESVAPPLPSNLLRDGQLSGSVDTTQIPKEKDIVVEEATPKAVAEHLSSPLPVADEFLGIANAALKNNSLEHLGIPASKMTAILLPKPAEETSSTLWTKGPEAASIEETLSLILHAIRRGVEVMAETNRIHLEAWPEEKKRGS